ncbi:MAG: hypothetical protein ACOYOF_09040 [Verrucomicrobiaceae bacterium]
MKRYRLFYLAAALCSAFPAIAQDQAHADVWVRHTTDIGRKGILLWQGNDLYDNNTQRQVQERTLNVSLAAPDALGTQTFYFNIQSDYFRNRWLWLRMINTHGFSKGAEPTFRYDATKWDVKINIGRADCTFIDRTDMIINWRKYFPNGDGYPLAQVGPEPGGNANVLIKVTIRPKMTPKPNTGVCISLWTPCMYCYPDCATATVVYK